MKSILFLQIKTQVLEQRLQEAQGTIVDQRHNLMELQSNNENLSQALLREQQEREMLDTK